MGLNAADSIKGRTNALSIDVEGFVESNMQSFQILDKYINHAREIYEIERNTDAVLELLNAANKKATFFFVGRLAKDLPGLIKKTSKAGHEVACHSYAHLRVYGVGEKEFKEKLSVAKCQIEDISGERVYGFRAPDFSITQANMWAIDVLKDLGFVYDSSIYPIGIHDVYGIKGANPFIWKFPNGLVEFPLSTINMFGKRVPFGGGGYFRLYPLQLTRLFISRINKRGHPCMFYIHPYEVGNVIPKISEISLLRKFRHYHNCKNGYARFKSILKTVEFNSVIQILRGHDEFKIDLSEQS
jgi:polysaccharide deacetylase family protein (PEP-CTERM system associated)